MPDEFSEVPPSLSNRFDTSLEQGLQVGSFGIDGPGILGMYWYETVLAAGAMLLIVIHHILICVQACIQILELDLELGTIR